MKCRFFEECGGCFYSKEYEQQLEDKRSQLQDIFGFEIDITSSPVTEGYRQRMDYVYAFGRLGLRTKGNFRKVVDIDKCRLISERMNSLLTKARQLLKKYNIEPYDYIHHSGYLRYVIMREAKFTGQLMLGFVTSRDSEEILPVIEELKEEAESIVWSINDTMTDTSYGRLHKSWNKKIEEDFDGIRYKITPNAFFQPNPYMAKEILKEIRKFVYGKTSEIYCGVGTITLYVADRTTSIEGAEESSEAVKLAKENALLNNINSSFTCQDASAYLNNNITADTIIADPPRSGMGRKVCRKIIWKKPKRIIIMSCNPKTLKEDLDILTKKYHITYLKGFDMFPHTQHVECLCVLEKKDA